jgi:hypothetical protein
MSTTTPNLGLTLPALTDVADITVINTNMTLIDTAIEANDTAIASNTTSIASTNQNVSTNTANITTINGEISTINNNVTTNTNSINTLNTEVATNTANIATLNSEIATANSNIALKAPINNPTFTGVATLPTNSTSDSLLISLNAAVTAAGTTQATATALNKDENIVTSGTGGVQIQGATTGKIVVVINRTSSAINVYPASGHYFDGLAINTPISLPANAFIELYGFSSTQWNTTINSVTNAVNTIIADAGGYFATKNVEAALQQDASNLASHSADNTRHTGVNSPTFYAL